MQFRRTAVVHPHIGDGGGALLWCLTSERAFRLCSPLLLPCFFTNGSLQNVCVPTTGLQGVSPSPVVRQVPHIRQWRAPHRRSDALPVGLATLTFAQPHSLPRGEKQQHSSGSASFAIHWTTHIRPLTPSLHPLCVTSLTARHGPSRHPRTRKCCERGPGRRRAAHVEGGGQRRLMRASMARPAAQQRLRRHPLLRAAMAVLTISAWQVAAAAGPAPGLPQWCSYSGSHAASWACQLPTGCQVRPVWHWERLHVPCCWGLGAALCTGPGTARPCPVLHAPRVCPLRIAHKSTKRLHPHVCACLLRRVTCKHDCTVTA